MNHPSESQTGPPPPLEAMLPQLRQPFAPEEVAWRVDAVSPAGDQCQDLASVDLRRYQERLDAVCGVAWQVRYSPWGERIICTLTIHGVARAGTGEMGTVSVAEALGGKAAEAQAFRQACALFGLGRYLDSLPAVWVAHDAQARRIPEPALAELQARYRTWLARSQATQPRPR